MSELCYGCFTQLENAGACPNCGYDPAEDIDKYPSSLAPGSILNGRYIVGRVLGQGGFGITYAAQDFATKERVAVKEFFPTAIANREATGQISSYGNQKENFEHGKEGFMEEANTLVDFKNNSHVVNVLDFFEECGTAYFVMEYVQGRNLKSYVKMMGGRLGEDVANQILLPIMEALGDVHSKGIIHRDIAPDNIIVTADGSAKLIDFGAARYSTGEKSQSLDVVLKHGYAPKEQYLRRGRQGPFTDVYAMAATYYYAVTGRVPPDALERSENDELRSPNALGAKLSPNVENALLKALQVQASDRFQTMADFAAAIKGETLVDTPVSSGAHTEKKTSNPLLLQADAHIKEKNWAEAEKTCNLLLESEPDSKDAQLLKRMIELEKGNAEAAKKEAKAKRRKRTKRVIRLIFALIPLSLLLFAGSFYLRLINQWSFDETTGTLTISSDIGVDNVIPGFIDKVNQVIYSVDEFVPGFTDFSTGWHIELDKYISNFSGETLPWDALDSQILTVIVEDGVTEIMPQAFQDCTALSSVSLPESIEYIGFEAFASCGELQEINLPDSLTYIGPMAFSRCTSLKEITLPAGLTVIEAGTFRACENLSRVALPSQLEEIGDYAFCGCKSLKGIYIPESVKIIGVCAFFDCRSLSEITLPEHITVINEKTFAECTGLMSLVLPADTEEIGAEAFYNCSSLTEIELPVDLKSIGSSAFSFCSSLTGITIPESTESIGYSAFYSCSALAEVVIPGSVASIGQNVFIGCAEDMEIYYGGDKNQWKNLSVQSTDLPEDVSVRYNYIP